MAMKGPTRDKQHHKVKGKPQCRTRGWRGLAEKGKSAEHRRKELSWHGEGPANKWQMVKGTGKGKLTRRVARNFGKEMRLATGWEADRQGWGLQRGGLAMEGLWGKGLPNAEGRLARGQGLANKCC